MLLVIWRSHACRPPHTGTPRTSCMPHGKTDKDRQSTKRGLSMSFFIATERIFWSASGRRLKYIYFEDFTLNDFRMLTGRKHVAGPLGAVSFLIDTDCFGDRQLGAKAACIMQSDRSDILNSCMHMPCYDCFIHYVSTTEKKTTKIIYKYNKFNI